MTALIGRVPHENGTPRVELPRPKLEWWVGDKRLTILPQKARPSRLYFHTEDGRQFRYHNTDETLALLRQNGKERREDTRPPAELRADPKWAGKLAERRTRLTATKTRRTWRWVVMELHPTRIAYYGETTTREVKRLGGGGVLVVHATTITYALHKTPETPHAFPLNEDQLHAIRNGRHPVNNHHRLHPTLAETYAEEARRQRKEKPELTHLLERGTEWRPTAYTTTTTTYSDGRKSKTETKAMTDAQAELPWNTSLMMLTGFSTKAGAGEIPQLATTNALDFDYKLKPLYATFEATRRLKGEVKRELCEAVFHPDRITRMAEKFDLAPDEYMESI